MCDRERPFSAGRIQKHALMPNSPGLLRFQVIPSRALHLGKSPKTSFADGRNVLERGRM